MADNQNVDNMNDVTALAPHLDAHVALAAANSPNPVNSAVNAHFLQALTKGINTAGAGPQGPISPGQAQGAAPAQSPISPSQAQGAKPAAPSPNDPAAYLGQNLTMQQPGFYWPSNQDVANAGAKVTGVASAPNPDPFQAIKSTPSLFKASQGVAPQQAEYNAAYPTRSVLQGIDRLINDTGNYSGDAFGAIYATLMTGLSQATFTADDSKSLSQQFGDWYNPAHDAAAGIVSGGLKSFEGAVVNVANSVIVDAVEVIQMAEHPTWSGVGHILSDLISTGVSPFSGFFDPTAATDRMTNIIYDLRRQDLSGVEGQRITLLGDAKSAMQIMTTPVTMARFYWDLYHTKGESYATQYMILTLLPMILDHAMNPTMKGSLSEAIKNSAKGSEFRTAIRDRVLNGETALRRGAAATYRATQAAMKNPLMKLFIGRPLQLLGLINRVSISRPMTMAYLTNMVMNESAHRDLWMNAQDPGWIPSTMTKHATLGQAIVRSFGLSGIAGNIVSGTIDFGTQWAVADPFAAVGYMKAQRMAQGLLFQTPEDILKEDAKGTEFFKSNEAITKMNHSQLVSVFGDSLPAPIILRMAQASTHEDVLIAWQEGLRHAEFHGLKAPSMEFLPKTASDLRKILDRNIEKDGRFVDYVKTHPFDFKNSLRLFRLQLLGERLLKMGYNRGTFIDELTGHIETVAIRAGSPQLVAKVSKFLVFLGESPAVVESVTQTLLEAVAKGNDAEFIRVVAQAQKLALSRWVLCQLPNPATHPEVAKATEMLHGWIDALAGYVHAGEEGIFGQGPHAAENSLLTDSSRAATNASQVGTVRLVDPASLRSGLKVFIRSIRDDNLVEYRELMRMFGRDNTEARDAIAHILMRDGRMGEKELRDIVEFSFGMGGKVDKYLTSLNKWISKARGKFYSRPSFITMLKNSSRGAWRDMAPYLENAEGIDEAAKLSDFQNTLSIAVEQLRLVRDKLERTLPYDESVRAQFEITSRQVRHLEELAKETEVIAKGSLSVDRARQIFEMANEKTSILHNLIDELFATSDDTVGNIIKFRSKVMELAAHEETDPGLVDHFNKIATLLDFEILGRDPLHNAQEWYKNVSTEPGDILARVKMAATAEERQAKIAENWGKKFQAVVDEDGLVKRGFRSMSKRNIDMFDSIVNDAIFKPQTLSMPSWAWHVGLSEFLRNVLAHGPVAMFESHFASQFAKKAQRYSQPMTRGFFGTAKDALGGIMLTFRQEVLNGLLTPEHAERFLGDAMDIYMKHAGGVAPGMSAAHVRSIASGFNDTDIYNPPGSPGIGNKNAPKTYRVGKRKNQVKLDKEGNVKYGKGETAVEDGKTVRTRKVHRESGKPDVAFDPQSLGYWSSLQRVLGIDMQTAEMRFMGKLIREEMESNPSFIDQLHEAEKDGGPGLWNTDLGRRLMAKQEKWLRDQPEAWLDRMNRSRSVSKRGKDLGFKDPYKDWARVILEDVKHVISSPDSTIIHKEFLDQIADGNVKTIQELAGYGRKHDPIDLPHQIYAPPFATGSGFEWFRVLQKGSDFMHSNILGPMVDHISRKPLYLWKYHQQMEQLRPFIKNMQFRVENLPAHLQMTPEDFAATAEEMYHSTSRPYMSKLDEEAAARVAPEKPERIGGGRNVYASSTPGDLTRYAMEGSNALKLPAYGAALDAFAEAFFDMSPEMMAQVEAAIQELARAPKPGALAPNPLVSPEDLRQQAKTALQETEENVTHSEIALAGDVGKDKLLAQFYGLTHTDKWIADHPGNIEDLIKAGEPIEWIKGQEAWNLRQVKKPTDAQLDAAVADLRANGFRRPIVIRIAKDGSAGVIDQASDVYIYAAQEIGLTHVPVKIERETLEIDADVTTPGNKRRSPGDYAPIRGGKEQLSSLYGQHPDELRAADGVRFGSKHGSPIHDLSDFEGVYERPAKHTVERAYTQGEDGQPTPNGWHVMDPEGGWVNVFRTKKEAEEAAKELSKSKFLSGDNVDAQREALRVLRSIKGNPEADVTVYKEGESDFQPGDQLALTPKAFERGVPETPAPPSAPVAEPVAASAAKKPFDRYQFTKTWSKQIDRVIEASNEDNRLTLGQRQQGFITASNSMRRAGFDEVADILDEYVAKYSSEATRKATGDIGLAVARVNEQSAKYRAEATAAEKAAAKAKAAMPKAAPPTPPQLPEPKYMPGESADKFTKALKEHGFSEEAMNWPSIMHNYVKITIDHWDDPNFLRSWIGSNHRNMGEIEQLPKFRQLGYHDLADAYEAAIVAEEAANAELMRDLPEVTVRPGVTRLETDLPISPRGYAMIQDYLEKEIAAAQEAERFMEGTSKRVQPEAPVAPAAPKFDREKYDATWDKHKQKIAETAYDDNGMTIAQRRKVFENASKDMRKAGYGEVADILDEYVAKYKNASKGETGISTDAVTRVTMQRYNYMAGKDLQAVEPTPTVAPAEPTAPAAPTSKNMAAIEEVFKDRGNSLEGLDQAYKSVADSIEAGPEDLLDLSKLRSYETVEGAFASAMRNYGEQFNRIAEAFQQSKNIDASMIDFAHEMADAFKPATRAWELADKAVQKAKEGEPEFAAGEAKPLVSLEEEIQKSSSTFMNDLDHLQEQANGFADAIEQNLNVPNWGTRALETRTEQDILKFYETQSKQFAAMANNQKNAGAYRLLSTTEELANLAKQTGAAYKKAFNIKTVADNVAEGAKLEEKKAKALAKAKDLEKQVIEFYRNFKNKYETFPNYSPEPKELKPSKSLDEKAQGSLERANAASKKVAARLRTFFQDMRQRAHDIESDERFLNEEQAVREPATVTPAPEPAPAQAAGPMSDEEFNRRVQEHAAQFEHISGERPAAQAPAPEPTPTPEPEPTPTPATTRPAQPIVSRTYKAKELFAYQEMPSGLHRLEHDPYPAESAAPKTLPPTHVFGDRAGYEPEPATKAPLGPYPDNPNVSDNLRIVHRFGHDAEKVIKGGRRTFQKALYKAEDETIGREVNAALSVGMDAKRFLKHLADEYPKNPRVQEQGMALYQDMVAGVETSRTAKYKSYITYEKMKPGEGAATPMPPTELTEQEKKILSAYFNFGKTHNFYRELPGGSVRKISPLEAFQRHSDNNFTKIKKAGEDPRKAIDPVYALPKGQRPRVARMKVYGKTLDLTIPRQFRGNQGIIDFFVEKKFPPDLIALLKDERYAPDAPSSYELMFNPSYMNLGHEQSTELINWMRHNGYGKARVMDPTRGESMVIDPNMADFGGAKPAEAYAKARKMALSKDGYLTHDQAEVIAETRAMTEMKGEVHNPADKTLFEQKVNVLAPFYFAKMQAWRRAFRMLGKNPGAFEQYLKMNLAVTNAEDQHAKQVEQGKASRMFQVPGVSAIAEQIFHDPMSLGFGGNALSSVFITGSGEGQGIGGALANELTPDVGLGPALVGLGVKMLANWIGEFTNHQQGAREINNAINAMEGPITAQQNLVQLLVANPLARNVGMMAWAWGNPDGKNPFGSGYASARSQIIMQTLQNRIDDTKNSLLRNGGEYYGHKVTAKQVDYSYKHEPQQFWLLVKQVLSQKLEDPHFVQAITDEVNKNTSFMWAAKSIISSAGPVSVNLENAGMDWAPVLDKYVQKAGNYTKGVDAFSKDHPDALLATVPTTTHQGQTVWQPTKAALDLINQNYAGVQKYPQAYGQLLPRPAGNSIIDLGAWSLETTMGLRGKTNIQGIVDAVNINWGNSWYFQIIKPLRDAGKMSSTQVQNWVDYYGDNYNPTWKKSWNMQASGIDAIQTRKQLLDLINDDDFRNNSYPNLPEESRSIAYHMVMYLEPLYQQWAAYVPPGTPKNTIWAESDAYKKNLDVLAQRYPDLQYMIDTVYKHLPLGVKLNG